jgi:transposase InsO family protein/transposase-like protein
VPGPTPHYPPEFKREAVQLYRSSGKSIPKMAKDLGIASESLRRWISQHEVDEGEREGLTTSEREELSRLRRENKTLRQEREFLKKAAASSLRGRKGLAELLLQAHRGGEDELPRPVVHVSDARDFEERLLRLERQTIFGKEPSGCRSHREDSGNPRTQSPHVWISQGPRRVEGARDSLWPQTGREAHAPSRPTRLHARQEKRNNSPKQEGAGRGPRKEELRSYTEVDRVWVADITYVATQEGFLYVAFILDVHSRRIVGWAMEPYPKTELVVDALQMAVWRRKPAPAGLVHHSDQGVQYTSLSFGERLKEVGIKPSMGRIGSALDNAMAESFASTLKAEMVSNMEFPTRQAAKTAIFEYLETFYNTCRLHSSLGYMSPADFEEDRMEEARVA